MTAQCIAINNALTTRGLTNAQLAAQTGINTQRIDGILAGNQRPTQVEFNSIARTLGLSNPPGDAAHVTA